MMKYKIQGYLIYDLFEDSSNFWLLRFNKIHFLQLMEELNSNKRLFWINS